MALHPQVKAFIAMSAEAGLPPIHELSAQDARVQMGAIRDMIPPGPQVATVRALTVPVTGAEVGARLYEPDGATATIVWLHGGGWVLADLDTHDSMCRILADSSGCRVVSIDYRLAPEHPFPTPLDDCWDALRWTADRYPGPLVVGGDSAGGNMAAVCAIRARDAGGPDLALQVLVYPVTDHDFETTSYVEHGDEGTLLGRAEMVWFFDHYAPEGTDRDDPAISPLREPDLSGLPPAIVVTDEYDPLCSEGRAYAARLAEAGVAVTAHHYDDMTHGFFSFVGVFDTGTESVTQVGQEVRAAL